LAKTVLRVVVANFSHTYTVIRTLLVIIYRKSCYILRCYISCYRSCHILRWKVIIRVKQIVTCCGKN